MSPLFRYSVFNHNGTAFHWIGTSTGLIYTPCHLGVSVGRGDCFKPVFSTSDNSLPSQTEYVVPVVISVTPGILQLKGGKLSIFGSNFRPGIGPGDITVTVADKICVAPVYRSTTLIECYVRPGVGGPHKVVVTSRGVRSAPRNLVSYFLPHIYAVSKSWVADGSRLLVTGSFFDEKNMKCRIRGYPEEEMATEFIDDSNIVCKVHFSNAAAAIDGRDRLGSLEISNDDGMRWVSGVTIDTPVEWGGGSVIPVSPQTVNWVKEVVIGGIIPTDYFSDAEITKQFVADITLAFNMAATAVNEEGFFPGGTQLRVEMLSVDPGGSGGPNMVTEVATAFAKKGMATNATDASLITNVIGFVGPLWSSNAIPAAVISNRFRLPMISYVE